MFRQKLTDDLKIWINAHIFPLLILNIYLVLLVLLRSAGYFEPYLSISINFIFVTSLLLTVFILNLSSKGSFIISLIFWTLSFILYYANILVWAERAGVYTYESLVLGVVLVFLESLRKKDKKE